MIDLRPQARLDDDGRKKPPYRHDWNQRHVYFAIPLKK